MRFHATTLLLMISAAVLCLPAGAQIDDDEVQEGVPPRRAVDDGLEDEQGSEVPPRYTDTERFPARDERDSNIDDQPEPQSVELQDQIDRGRYLTHSVAMCVICHSPKNEQGLPIQGQHFEGGVIPAKPTDPNMKPWADFAPALGPMVRGTEDEVIELLTTGIWPRTGRSPQPPMPPFRLTEEDAQAIIAFLKTQNL